MKKKSIIPLLVVGLPAGLFFLIIFSLIRFQFKKETAPMDPNEGKRLEAASLNQKDINREDLESFLNVIAERIGERNVGKPEKLESAAIWIESMLGGGNFGYHVTTQKYEVDGTPVRNIIAELPGTDRRQEVVVIGAHYDSVPGSPAANDNGSGVAALLLLAQAFAGNQQSRTVRFVAFVNEEPPYFQTEEMGSRVYARACAERGDKIVSMLALDTIGFYSDEEGSQQVPEGLEGNFPTKGDFLAFVGNEQSKYIADSARAAFVNASGLPGIGGAFPEEVDGVGWSDHWSFWKSGFPAVMVTDTAPYRYPHYHTPEDTVDKIDFERLEKACIGLQAVVETWANP